MNRVHDHLRSALTDALLSMGVTQPRVILEKPREAAHGDVATNVAMVHAKDLGRPPRAIAESLAGRLSLDSSLVESCEVAGPGFINFVFAPEYLRSIALLALRDPEHFGETRDLSEQRIHIEFVSANPSGPLNVVSARAAAVGDSLARLFRSRGAECHTEFYVNDAGNQIRLLGESVRARYETLLGKPVEVPEGGYHGEYLIEFAEGLQARHGTALQRSDPSEEAEELGRMAAGHFVALHKETLERFGVQFDHWFFESELRGGQQADISTLNMLRQRGVTYQKDGATYLATSQFGDSQDWVIVTSDGRPTYFLPDIAYHINKFDRGYDHVLNILGPDHHSFSAKMKAALRALGKEADRLEVILLQHVNLLRDGQVVKMSKRAGQIIEMAELLDEVGVDAARYFFLLRRTSTPLDFDIELAKQKCDDNPVFYVQYAHARIESIFRRAGVRYPDAATDLSALVQPEELALLRTIRMIADVIAEATSNRDPHGMTVWLRDVATCFHKFYQTCRVLTDPPELQMARLALCRATQVALQRGLFLCGVSAPKSM